MSPVDPFDLPEWLGVEEVTWTPQAGIRLGFRVPGCLTPTTGGDPGGAGDTLPCDLLAVDEAYPRPVVTDDVRSAAHQTWRHGQVTLMQDDERLTLLVPGTSFTADLVLDAIGRFAAAVGASADRYAVHLRIGSGRASSRSSRGQ